MSFRKVINKIMSFRKVINKIMSFRKVINKIKFLNHKNKPNFICKSVFGGRKFSHHNQRKGSLHGQPGLLRGWTQLFSILFRRIRRDGRGIARPKQGKLLGKGIYCQHR